MQQEVVHTKKKCILVPTYPQYQLHPVETNCANEIPFRLCHLKKQLNTMKNTCLNKIVSKTLTYRKLLLIEKVFRSSEHH